MLLYKVADPIRRYLRSVIPHHIGKALNYHSRERPDTIRNIVASLVGEGGDLLDEHEQGAPLQQPQIEDYSEPNWEPEPIDAGPGKDVV